MADELTDDDVRSDVVPHVIDGIMDEFDDDGEVTDDSKSSSKLIIPPVADNGGADILYEDWRTKWRRINRGGTTVEWYRGAAAGEPSDVLRTAAVDSHDVSTGTVFDMPTTPPQPAQLPPMCSCCSCWCIG